MCSREEEQRGVPGVEIMARVSCKLGEGQTWLHSAKVTRVSRDAIDFIGTGLV